MTQQKERTASLKFVSFESAEKAFFDASPKYAVEFAFPHIQKFLKSG